MSKEHKPTAQESQAEVLAAALKAREEEPRVEGSRQALEAALQAKFNPDQKTED